MIPGACPVIAGAAPFKVKAVHFDGSSGYVGRSSALSGVSPGNQLVFSAWVRITSAAPSGSVQFIFGISDSGGGSPGVSIYQNPLYDDLYAEANNSGGSTVVGGSTAIDTLKVDSTWHHIAFCGNGSSSASIIIDGVTKSVFALGGTVPFNLNTVRIGRAIGGNNLPAWFKGDMAEVYFATTFLDLSVPSNLAKFRTSLGKPAFLGLDGSLPTGSQPAVYLSGPASSITSNKGSGGSFFTVGSVTDASTSPSD